MAYTSPQRLSSSLRVPAALADGVALVAARDRQTGSAASAPDVKRTSHVNGDVQPV
jgi:hypothetical protein